MSSTQMELQHKAQRFKQRMVKKVIMPLMSPLYLDLQPDYRSSIFLAGTERSGTTWISDIINYKGEYRYLFEPFWPHKVALCSQFRPQQYLRPEDENPYFLQTAEQILSGKIRNLWVDKYHRTFIARQRLIKDVRANLFLKWLHTHFPQMPIALIMRHPCAVVRSQLREKWQPNLKRDFLAQNDLVADFLQPVEKEIEEVTSKFDAHLFRWCVQNYVPLRQFQKGEIHLAFYENFCVDPETEISRLFGYLDKPYSPEALSGLSTPSPVTQPGSPIMTGGDLIDSWRKHISPEQVKRAVEIMSLFGLDQIYGEESLPNPQGADEFWRSHSAQ
jgi:hypothetical protein